MHSKEIKKSQPVNLETNFFLNIKKGSKMLQKKLATDMVKNEKKKTKSNKIIIFIAIV